VEEALGRILASGHVRLGGEVHHERRPLLAHDLRQLWRGDVEADGLHRIRGQVGDPALVPRVGVEVDVQDGLSVGGERAHERRADEAQPAGHEHAAAHGSRIPSPAPGSSDARA
jgi:hypothetical protein